MPFHLDILKRHSDPAPCTKNKNMSVVVPPPTRSVPDLRLPEYSSSPSRSPMCRRTSTSTPNHGHLRRSRAIRYRRLSSNGCVTPNTNYFSTTPRRATHPNTSPRKFRRGSLWLEEQEPDPWLLFRLKGLGTIVPNGDDKPFMASNGVDGTCPRMRSFSVTSKGVVNLGDLLRARSHSDASVSSEELERCFRYRRDSAESTTSSLATTVSSSKYRVLLLGAEGVGKTSLVSQFTLADSFIGMTDPQASVDGSEERTVSLMVDGEEYELTCEDPLDSTYELDDTAFCSNDAFLVVYSVADKKSFHDAKRILNELRDLKNRCSLFFPKLTNKSVILVANKVDLVRCRLVSAEDGRTIAGKYEIKYVETSAGFSHNVDELLVGIVTQIRLQNNHSTSEIPRPYGFTYKAKGMMNRLLQKCELKTRSCDNLHVL